jgi:CheY-like chemotaxis protein
MKKFNELKILVVDDDPELLSTTLDMFQLFGLTCTGAVNGVKAMEHLETSKFDLVLSDIRMPEMNGLELLKKIRARDPKEPVVFLTSGFHEYEMSDLFAQGVNGFFQKPVSSSSLRGAISRAVTPPVQRWSTAPEKCQTHIKKDFPLLADVFSSPDLYWGHEGFSTHLPGPALQLGDYVSFEFKLATGAFLTVQGAAQVKWQKAQLYGLTIEYLEDSARRGFCEALGQLSTLSTIGKP